MHLSAVIIIIIIIGNVSDCARILAVIQTSAYSHQVAFRNIWRELSLRGHQVTLLTTDPINDPNLVNLTEIDLNGSYEIWNKNLAEMSTSNMWKSIWLMSRGILSVEEYQLSHPLIQGLIRNESEHFDLVMTEYFMTSYSAFGERFKCPTIILVSIDIYRNLASIMGNPSHPIAYPEVFEPNTETVLDRTKTILFNAYVYLLNTFYLTAVRQEMVYKYFGTDYPSLQEMLWNTDMVFTNSNPILHRVRSLVPTIIQIGGGLHSTPNKPLPKELKQMLDSGKEGFIYFSLGSNVKSKDLDAKTRSVIVETFAELPYKVLWKFEVDAMPDKPKNVITQKWLPQQDVLKHHNIKLFISQCGLQSMDETVYARVPMLCMPFFGDQEYNGIQLVKNGFGLTVNHKTLTKEVFKKSILEILNNSKFKERVTKLAELVMDQPMTGLQKAVWWTEYVIRHKGAKHLRSPLLDLPTYQYYLLDVIAVLGGVIVAILTTSIVIIRCLTKFVCKKAKVKVQ